MSVCYGLVILIKAYEYRIIKGTGQSHHRIASVWGEHRFLNQNFVATLN